MGKHRLNVPLGFDIAKAAYKQQPFPVIREMHAAGAVVPVKIPILGRVWMTTTHAANEAMVKDNRRFVQEGRNAGTAGLDRLMWWMPRSLKLLTENMLLKDEPDHRRLRTLVDKAFARRGILEMRPRVEALADRLIDRMDASGPVDLVPAYARALPLEVICELLGLPDRDRTAFSEWTRAIAGVNGVLGILRMTTSLNRFVGYMREQIEQCRHSPRPGLISALIEAEEDGARLTENELLAMVAMLLVAGFETTTHLIGGSLYTLETHPDQKAYLLEDPDKRIERSVEELLRYWTPVQNTKQRFIAEDMEFHGQALRRGEVIIAFLAGANADPTVFDAPETLNFDRFPNPHLAFSSGIHFCLGLQLARLEAQVAITRLYARHPNLRMRPPAASDWMSRFGLRGFKRLFVELA